MVELAIHQEPLHQMDVFLAGGAGAAERVALHPSYTCIGGLAQLMQATLFEGKGGRWRERRREGKGGDGE